MGGLFDFIRRPQGGGLLDGGLFTLAQTKRKIFVSYHHGGDRAYYDMLCTTFCDKYDVIYDNSPERRIDSEDVDYVRRRLCDNCITGSSRFGWT
jgi:Thoeris protein ThsB, TIR-like domain